MVAHVVLLKPRPNLTREERQLFVETFEQAVTKIPTVRSVRIGTRVRHGAGYESVAPDAGDYLAVLDFDDVAGLKEYLQHPAHAQLGLLFGSLLTAAMVYDFEVGSIDRLRELL